MGKNIYGADLDQAADIKEIIIKTNLLYFQRKIYNAV
jgi:hypothetical protein